jgi:cytosine/adenosine deaminase-related metal-dependent hydrolase
MILKARIVVPMDGPPLENVGVAVDHDSIVAIGSVADLRWLDDGPVYDLGDVALMPGLINAHCHLDYSTMRHAISPPRSFTAWVQRINAIKRSQTPEDYITAIQRGFAELKRFGTTSVCNIEAFPELMPAMGEPPVRTWWFYEMIDVRHRITTEDVVVGALSFFETQPHSLNRFGLSPHAPYTASRSLYELANACARTMRMALTTHVAESSEETNMFSEARGQLFDFMASIGRPMADCGQNTSFAQLWRSGAINGDWILAHMNELSQGDFALLESVLPPRRPHIVHCPGSHAYFGHERFSFRRLAEMGVNISIGTDSLASTNSLSLFEEMRRLQQSEPWLSPEKILRTVTVNPAAALRRARRLGCIAPGALADLIAIPVNGPLKTVCEEIIDFRQPVPWMMIDGKIRTP